MRVAIIPARAGSQRIPGKNIRPFHGKPIIAYSIRAALDTRLFDHVIVSTDSEEIAEIAQACEADVLIRPAALADGKTGTQEVMRHHLQAIDAEQACCIYATAPMLTAADLLRGWQQIHRPGVVYSFAVGTEPQLHDAGQFYWGSGWAFREGAPLWHSHSAMVPIDPRRVCDINTEDDWIRAEVMYACLHHRGCNSPSGACDQTTCEISGCPWPRELDLARSIERNKNAEWARRHNEMLNKRGVP